MLIPPLGGQYTLNYPSVNKIIVINIAQYSGLVPSVREVQIQGNPCKMLIAKMAAQSNKKNKRNSP